MAKVWELRIARAPEQSRKGKRRTPGKYQVFHDGIRVKGLSGACAETKGPGDNSTAGNNRCIEPGRYPLSTQDGYEIRHDRLHIEHKSGKVSPPGLAADEHRSSGRYPAASGARLFMERRLDKSGSRAQLAERRYRFHRQPPARDRNYR
jgi:hypothetical protein